MLHSRTLGQENDAYTASPSRTPGMQKGGDVGARSASPFKREQGKGSAPPRRNAFADKTNQSPSPGRRGPVPFGSPSKLRSPEKAAGPWSSVPRKQEFVTPATNIGRAGQLKARMGEMHDPQTHTVPVSPQAPFVSEEELYPEIETMPTSEPPPFLFPAELDGLPRAAEIGRWLGQMTWPTEDHYSVPESIEIPPLPGMETATSTPRAPAPRRNTLRVGSTPFRSSRLTPSRRTNAPAKQDALAVQAALAAKHERGLDGFPL